MLGGIKFGKRKASSEAAIRASAAPRHTDDYKPLPSKYSSSNSSSLSSAKNVTVPRVGLYDPKNPDMSAAVLTTADSRSSKRRRGALSKKQHQDNYNESNRSVEDMVRQEMSTKCMDESYTENVLRAGGRYKGGEWDADGDQTDHNCDMTLFTDKADRVTALKRAERAEQKRKEEESKFERVQSKSTWWVKSSNFYKQQLIALGDHATLFKTPLHQAVTPDQLSIVPVHHCPSLNCADDGVWEEVERFKSSLRSIYAKESKDVLFAETFLSDGASTSSNGMYQGRIECLPVPSSSNYPLAFYQAMSALVTDEVVNTKLIKLGAATAAVPATGKSANNAAKVKTVRNSVPSGFSYFSVQWLDSQSSREVGYTTVIDDVRGFPRSFAVDVVAGILDVEEVRFNRKAKSNENDRLSTLSFLKKWKEFDWTVELG